MAYGENFLFARPSPPLRSPFFFFLAYLRRAPVGRPCSSVHPPLSLPYAARRTGAHLGVRKGYSPTVMDRTDRAGKKEKHIGARRNLVSAPLAENINSPIQNITHPPPPFFFLSPPFSSRRRRRSRVCSSRSRRRRGGSLCSPSASGVPAADAGETLGPFLPADTGSGRRARVAPRALMRYGCGGGLGFEG